MSLNYCVYCMHPLNDNENVCCACGRLTESTVPEHHLKCGTVLRDKYLVGKALGEGGFGITYIGRDLTLDMRIAIKEYYPNGCANRSSSYSNAVTMTRGNYGIDYEKDMRQFLSEARILARFCNEPGVVGVRDFFRENGTAYIVMEYLDGVTLKSYIQKNGPIPAETFLRMIDPILQALSDIHKQGLIHRDISPDNIMMLKNGRLKLLDFGAAREATGDKSLSVVLKPGYAPEEQYRSKGQQGSWTDVYAMCATIYKCITGVTPEDSMQRVFEDEMRLPSQLGVAISADYEAALMQGLNVKSRDRIQTMDALRKAFMLDDLEDAGRTDIYRTDVTDREAANDEGEKSVGYQENTSTMAIQQDKSEVTEHGDGLYVTASHDEEKTVCQLSKNQDEQGLTDGENIGATEPQESAVSELKRILVAKHGVDTIKLPNDIVAEKKIMDKGRIGKKIKPLYIAIGALLLAAIIAIGLITEIRNNTPQTNLRDSLPTESEVANDCSSILKWKDITGSVQYVSIRQKDLNEKEKILVVSCDVAVLEDSVEKQYLTDLYYEYKEDAWVLSNLSKIDENYIEDGIAQFAESQQETEATGVAESFDTTESTKSTYETKATSSGKKDSDHNAEESIGPAKETEATESTEPVKETEATESTEPVKETEATESTEPVKETDATESTEPVEEAEETEPSEFDKETETTESNESVQETQATGFTESIQESATEEPSANSDESETLD